MLFKDIIIFNIISSYYNCSLIMACFYKYILYNCKNVKWFMKLDVDTYVNISMLMKILINTSNKVSVIGAINKNKYLHCNSDYKWSINCKNKSNSQLNLPPYPLGPAFLFKSPTLYCIDLYFKSNEDIIWIEDVLFGMIMNFCSFYYYDVSKLSDLNYKQKNNLSVLKNKVFVHGLYPIEIFLSTIF